ncbi:MAG: alpha/beta hydrolase [Proteobacteria bacterium]|nr:alpha/beta hydrolase [Pseudomonadota bacterium]
MSHRLLSLAGLFVLSAAVALGTACKKKTDSVIESTESNYTVQDKRIYFIYGALIRSVSVSELEIFAQKGIAGGDIANFIKFGKLDANALRRQLSKEYALDLVETSTILNNPVGTAILNKLGDAVHPHLTKNGSAQAVRAAIIASLQDDNKLTPLEVLRNLPVNMDVEIETVLKLKDELADAFLKG